MKLIDTNNSDTKKLALAKARNSFNGYTLSESEKKNIDGIKDGNAEVKSGWKQKLKMKGAKAYGNWKQNVKVTAKDMLNPNSQFKGPGRLLQLTGTAGMAKRFVDSSHSMSETTGLSKLEKDELIVDGFLHEINLINDTESGKLEVSKDYELAKEKVRGHLKRTKVVNLKNIGGDSLKIDKTYSAWERFNIACDLIN